MPISSQRARILGSFCGKLAFIGKLVLGRFRVFFNSSGTLCFSPKWLIFHYREPEEVRPLSHDKYVLRRADRWHGSGSPIEPGNVVPNLKKKSVQFSSRVIVCSIQPSESTGECQSRSEEHTSELQSRENLVCR